MDEDPRNPEVEALNDRYLETLAEQSELRSNGYVALQEADASSSLDVVRETLARENRRFEGDLVVPAACDFGYPAAFVPEHLDPSSALNRLLDELHREEGKWREDESLAPVRDALRDAEPTVHKVLPALLADDGIRYDLPSGTDPRANFVTIRQAAGLVDWLANSYQAEELTVEY